MPEAQIDVVMCALGFQSPSLPPDPAIDDHSVEGTWVAVSAEPAVPLYVCRAHAEQFAEDPGWTVKAAEQACILLTAIAPAGITSARYLLIGSPLDRDESDYDGGPPG